MGFSHTPDHLVRQFTQLHRFSVGGLAGVNLLGDYHQFSQSQSGSGTALDGTPYTYQYFSSVSPGRGVFCPGHRLSFGSGKDFRSKGILSFGQFEQYYSSYCFQFALGPIFHFLLVLILLLFRRLINRHLAIPDSVEVQTAKAASKD